jgi:gamma-glutamyltranspeptidase / glutathione hydrolase
MTSRLRAAALIAAAVLLPPLAAPAQQPATPPAARPGTPPAQPEWPLPPVRTQKPPLHGRHWMAITGKPLAATAGAAIFQRGGNAVDAACAMLAATATMWDVLSWGGETQALIYHPKLKKVIGINALGVAPTGATAAFYKSKGYQYPPEYGPLAAVTPGTPGGLMTMLAEYGTKSLAEVLAPAIQMADGYPIEAQTANSIERMKDTIRQWKYSRAVFLTHPGQAREAPEPGEIFVQKDLAATLRKLVESERQALRAGKTRKQAIYAAYDRFYKGDVAQELVRGVREEGGLFTTQDLATWKVKIEEPVSTTYKGIAVYKLPFWQQGPAMLQALNILENADLKAMGYNSPRYIHTVYQAMSMAFADRDFYYGDPYFPPEEPTRGLLSKEYARARWAAMSRDRNDPNVKPGDPYPYQGGTNPFAPLLARWTSDAAADTQPRSGQQDRVVPATPVPATPATPMTPSPDDAAAEAADDAIDARLDSAFYAGTTSIETADTTGWVVSITPSGGWVPAVIAGRTGVGLSQRAQSFVTRAEDGPFNVIEPGKRPRVTLTPTLALKDGRPFLSFAVQGGDSQDQNLLQFFLNVVEFGMTVQQASEAPNVNSYQMRASFGEHENRPGRLLVASSTPEPVRQELQRMGYTLEVEPRTSGPINAIWFDWRHGSFWGGSSNHGEDYGIAW